MSKIKKMLCLGSQSRQLLSDLDLTNVNRRAKDSLHCYVLMMDQERPITIPMQL